MKITKKVEAEIKALMDDYWDAYFRGDLKHWRNYLVEDYRNIGGTEEEIWNSKKEILDYTRRIIHQMAGQAEIRNKKTQIIPYDPYIMVHEFMDLFIKAEGKWAFYGKFRLSSLIQKIDGEWKVLHQHGSYPDAHTEQGEAFAFDKLRKENTRLRDAVKRRTIELENKNRELEIETALERVRTIALGMKEPADMLEVCKTISLQLQELGVKEIRNVQTAIFYVNRGTYMNYEYYAKHKKTFITETFYTDHKIAKAFAAKMLKGKGAVSVTYIKGEKKVKEWLAYQKGTNVFIDKFLEKASSLNYYWHSLGPVALGISTYVPLDKAELNLFNRFLNVFELAYTRYLDIEQALVQAKEARIELALERVRARAMAMQHSGELAALVATVFKELTQLDFSLTSCIIWIHDHEQASNTLWIASAEMNKPAQPFRVDPFYTPFFKSIIHAWKVKDPKWIFTLTGMEKKNFEKAFFKELPALPDTLRKALKIPKQVVFSASFNNFGALEIVETEALTDEKFSILHRFGKVFNSSYTRFNDLKKAEAQAREAQVELALERIRARTMAMQHSDELAETAAVLFEQFYALGEMPERMAIEMVNEAEHVFDIWATDHGGKQMDSLVKVSLDEPHVMQKMYRAWKDRTKSITIDLQGKELEEYFNYLKKSGLPVQRKIFAKRRVQNVATFSKGILTIITPGPKPPETIHILERFAAVFDGTYTRFLDLQKAEAQAREAQIETALEKVRSRTMAMQHSDELPDAAINLFVQVQVLGIPVWAAGYCIWDEDKQGITLWMSSEGVMQASIHAPLTEDPSFIHMKEAYERGDAFYVEGVGGEALVAHYQYVRSLPGTGQILDSIISAGHPVPTYQIFHCVYFSQGFLLFTTYEAVPEAHEIFKRFGKVFDQTYTRFLDLQKAEMQSREAQIELGLERVRARAMAMQTSEELNALIGTVFSELTRLDLVLTRCVIMIHDPKTNDARWWMANSEAPDQPMNFLVTYHTHPPYLAYHNAWKEKKSTWVYTLEGAEKKEWDDYIFSQTELSRLPGFVIDGMRAPERVYLNASFYNFGNMTLASLEPLSEEQFDIMIRFARVFDLTYTRFNDLKQAEAQARESQIELGLERVRARAMAMQNSEELKDLIGTVYSELTKLDVILDRCFIAIFDPNTKGSTWWMANPETPGNTTGLHMQYHEMPPYLAHLKAWKEQQLKWTYTLEGKVKKEWDGFIFTETEWSNIPSFVINNMRGNERVFLNASFNSFGCLTVATLDPLSDEQFDILFRFAKVFDLTYTRFNDLQKAEAQAREAKIEASLERVRAGTMAMYKSEDLSKVTEIVFKELDTLELGILRCGIGIINKETRNADAWITSVSEEGKTVQVSGTESMDQHPLLQGAYDAWLNHTDFSYVLEGEDLVQYYKTSGVGKVRLPDSQLILSADEITTQFYQIAVFEAGGLFAFRANAFPEEAKMVMKRFAVVFNQSYTRFLDLQKAEAQAREAQIEASLERVRAHAMAMHNSADLSSTVNIFFKELKTLGIIPMRCGVGEINEDTHSSDLVFTTADKQGELYELPGKLKHEGHPVVEDIYNYWKQQEEYHPVLQGTDINAYYRVIKSQMTLPDFPDYTIHYGNYFYFREGFFFAWAEKEFTEEAMNIFRRFTSVLSLTYKRYKDLKQAEAQARESQIELGLERVRARAMAMQKSDELANAAQLLYHEFGNLGIKTFSCGYMFIDEEKQEQTAWVVLPDGSLLPNFIVFPLTGDPVLDSRYQDWKEKKPLHIYEIEGEANKEHHRFLANYVPPFVVDEIFSKIPERIIFNSANFSDGYLLILATEPFSPEEQQTIIRFAKVFEMTYTRFNDLKQAEAQARESRIQLAMERVRARTMAMQNSEELAEAVAIIFEELDKLDANMLRCGIGITNKKTQSVDVWTTTIDENNKVVQVAGDESMDIHPLLRGAYEAWLKQEDYEYILEGEDLENYYKALTGSNFRLPDSQSLVKGTAGITQYYFNAMFSAGGFFAFRNAPFPPEAKKIMKRFADVFNLTYTRFNDLKQAEEQAREARIETSLERVRSKAMAMHSSEDLATTVDAFFTELKAHDISTHRCGVTLINEETRIADVTLTTALKDGESQKVTGKLKLAGHPILDGVYEHWKQQEEFHPVLHGAEIKEYYGVMNPQVSFPDFAEDKTQFGHYFFFKEGGVFAWTEKKLSEETLQLFRKFTSVLSLTYRRYMDLVEAEAQVRESQIEAALEKVRGKAMSMHNSSDLSSTASMVFTELRKLGITPVRCGVGLLTKSSRRAHLYATSISEQGDELALLGTANLEGHPVLSGQYDHWIKKEDYFPVLKGSELKNYSQKISTNFKLPDIPPDYEQFGCFLPFAEGFLYCWSEKPYDQKEIKILNRFKAIIDLTFRRYIELQKAEANARDAVRQASLDRVRAETASMRTPADLEKITPLLWKELKILGVPFTRCGVFIMDEGQQQIHTFLSTPDGNAIAAFHLPYTTPGTTMGMLEHWRRKEMYRDHWDEAAFKEWTRNLVETRAITSSEKYLTGGQPLHLDLHFLPFLQGMLYVGNDAPLNEEEIGLVQSLANAFSTAYARYEDFNKLESAKQQIEKTLADLKQAQAQLVQSEKMASLGELTAGIAHEIQNPLNFVNNFSEVSNELLDEMIEEVKKGNYQQVETLVNDVKQNLEKINHHGKRADGIVKGMLQHSRSSSGQKEPTDINALADEYFRLAYHGLRAKDKTFNATIKTDYDENIGKINIIPQDIGRVILNLITNAFYAVTDKKKSGPAGYEPMVTVRTSLNPPPTGGDQQATVVIAVKDNGNGIPAKALDKIFQPFFTTKPTGQGTGLGLSLSYDIVKAHGGELKAETKEGEGSTFIINLAAL